MVWAARQYGDHSDGAAQPSSHVATNATDRSRVGGHPAGVRRRVFNRRDEVGSGKDDAADNATVDYQAGHDHAGFADVEQRAANHGATIDAGQRRTGVDG
jgi:hypothetical protein